MNNLNYYRAREIANIINNGEEVKIMNNNHSKASEILEATIQNGGFSWETYHSGYMVSLEGSEVKIKYTDPAQRASVINQIEFYIDMVGQVNTWLDDGIIYLDISVNVEDLQEALTFAEENKQLAIYDCTTGESIEVSK